MIGDRHGNFRPSHSITRAEVAAIMTRTQLFNFETGVRGFPEGMTRQPFSDVRNTHWAYYYIAWAADAGFILGDMGTTNFRPNAPITRQELAAIITRVSTESGQAYVGISTFPDRENASDWAQIYLYTVQREGLMIGGMGNWFRPRDNITRAETATVVNRLLGRFDSLTAWDAAEHENAIVVTFPDMVRPRRWYYPAVVAATNDHYLTRGEDGRIDWVEYRARPAS